MDEDKDLNNVDEHLEDEQLDNTNEDLDEKDVSKEEDESQDSDDETEEDNEEKDDEGELSPRQQRRVEQLEKKAEELKLTKILDRIQGVKKPQSDSNKTKSNPLDYRTALDAPDEVIDTLSQDRDNYGKEQLEVGRNEAFEYAKAAEWRTNIKIDLPLVKDEMSKLHPDDAAAIDREYLMYSQYDAETGRVGNPGIGYAEFALAKIQHARRIAANIAAESQKNITKQAAQTGLRPDGGGRKIRSITSADDIANMSDEEWEKNREAYLKQIGISKR